MAKSGLEWYKEAVAEQLVRLVRLIPIVPDHIVLSGFGDTDPLAGIPALLVDQNTQALYFRMYEIASTHLGAYGMVDGVERITEAVDIVELAKNKLTGKAQPNEL
jgi:hypothetical protein